MRNETAVDPTRIREEIEGLRSLAGRCRSRRLSNVVLRPMVDVLTPAQRHFNMSRISGKHTRPEMVVRSLVHRMGFRCFRYRLRSAPTVYGSLCKHIVLWQVHSNDCLLYTSDAADE